MQAFNIFMKNKKSFYGFWDVIHCSLIFTRTRHLCLQPSVYLSKYRTHTSFKSSLSSRIILLRKLKAWLQSDHEDGYLRNCSKIEKKTHRQFYIWCSWVGVGSWQAKYKEIILVKWKDILKNNLSILSFLTMKIGQAQNTQYR